MNRRWARAAAAAALVAVAGCSHAPSGDIGTVDVQRIVTHWPKFINYQNQLNADVAAIQQSRDSQNEKNRRLADVQRRFQTNQTELTNDVRTAATSVAGTRHLRFVLTAESIGYGGTDITPDVEKVLQIVETSPKP
jgi:Skp family chaperone for outer membrane proteins